MNKMWLHSSQANKQEASTASKEIGKQAEEKRWDKKKITRGSRSSLNRTESIVEGCGQGAASKYSHRGVSAGEGVIGEGIRAKTLELRVLPAGLVHRAVHRMVGVHAPPTKNASSMQILPRT